MDADVLLEEERARFRGLPLEEHMERYLSEGMTKKEAMRQVANDRGISRRDVYHALLVQEERIE